MVDYFQPTKYPDAGLQLKVVHKRVHFTTNPGLWLNLSRYLRDAGCIKFIFMLPRAGGSVGLHAYFNARLRKYVDRPAAILGLNKEQVRRRIMFYTPYCPCGRCVENPFWGTSAPDSFLVYLARNKDYGTLALRVLIADRVAIEAVFGDEGLKNKITGETASLEDLVQTARGEDSGYLDGFHTSSSRDIKQWYCRRLQSGEHSVRALRYSSSPV